MGSMRLRVGLPLVAAGVVGLLVTAVAVGGSSAAKVGSRHSSATKSVCGAGNGKKASGRPIKVGGIYTQVPGIDFTTIGKIASAYFQCVNDNGGIHGRPVVNKIYTEQLKPEQNAALARKLATSDRVVGVVGSTSLIECAVNARYWKAQGYNNIIAGVPGECFGNAAYAPVNMGPRYSDIGAAQALVRAGAKSIVISSPSTIAAYADGGVLLVAKKAGIPGKSIPGTLPITDPNSLITQLVQAAGPGGGVILDYTPESATPLMKAAIAQGVVNQVKWGSSTPIANASMASELGQFDGHLWINSEFNLLTTKLPDQVLYNQITKKYAPSIPIQSFGQMGFMVGKFVTAALLSVKGPVTKASYNAAVLKLRNQKTDMLCKPWYYGNLPFHIPNNWDRTVDYKNGVVVQKENCFAIADVDPAIKQTRAFEKKFHLQG
jgi:branched-chain amino acid transport system substrate-binding protein